MLHEVLLSLTGHISPLYDPITSTPNESFPNLSPPEAEILGRAGRLSTLVRLIGDQVKLINKQRQSSICKATATAINALFMSRFQAHVIKVERSILKKDDNLVGAYNIVSLAALLGEFEEWPRLMEWLYQLTLFILPSQNDRSPCNGAELMDKLKAESHTGYPDIGEACLQLSNIAEFTWMKQLSNWLLFGQLSNENEFCIQSASDDQLYVLVDTRTPAFLNLPTASSILYIGKSLRQVQERSSMSILDPSSNALISDHSKVLSSLSLPITSSGLNVAVASIRSSLSKNVLQKFLPREKSLQLMSLLKEIFLLGHGDFAISMIREADFCLCKRKSNSSSSSMSVKSGEVSSILRKTWSRLLASDVDDQFLDLIDLARDLLYLAPGKLLEDKKQKTNTFNDFLLPTTPVYLTLKIVSPFDLFMTPAHVKQYSDLNMYLIAIRRANIHLSDLWKESSLRKDYPTPRSCTTGPQIVAEQRIRRFKRFCKMRNVWATCSTSLFLLSELGEYFEGHVIPNLWSSLLGWIQAPNTCPFPSPLDLPDSANTVDRTHDPEFLTRAQDLFINTLKKALLFTDQQFTLYLRDLLCSIDNLVAQILRLQRIYQNIDLEQDEGVVDRFENNTEKELNDCQMNLNFARGKVESGSRSVISRLRQYAEHSSSVLAETHSSGCAVFESSNAPKIETLLMKLDFGQSMGLPV